MATAMDSFDSTVLITGGSSGIGFELARKFAAAGHDLILAASNSAKLITAAEALQSEFAGIGVTVYPCDLSTEDGARELYAAVKRDNRQVDILVNNAGVGVYGEFTGNPLDEEIAMVHLNALAPMVLTKLFVQDMLKRGQGKILFTASVAGVAPTPYLLVYSATKAFIYHFAEGLRDELRDTNVTVTALLPGETDTNFFGRAGMEGKVDRSKMDSPEEVAQAGYDALMNNDDHVVVSMKNKLQVTMAKVLPISTVTAQARME